MELSPGVDLAVKGWRLGAKANTFPSRLISSLLPLHPRGEASIMPREERGLQFWTCAV